MAELLQWNIRGLQANREELSLLISSLKPHVVALQETKIGNKHNISFQFKITLYIILLVLKQMVFNVYHGAVYQQSALIINKTIPHKLLNWFASAQL